MNLTEMTREELQAIISNMALEMTALCNARSKLEQQLEEMTASRKHYEEQLIIKKEEAAELRMELDDALESTVCDQSDPEFELLNSLCEYVNTFGGNPIEYLKDRCRDYSLELKA
ncbi:hypothetical protein [Thiothrix winogradskyi]|uniref:Uncharacterized protein n=1 Tax=Thiothrix winogradskyi TaxID=96472 RepID=A0ABY3T6R4_9GAMM|nr:hypothetical protein [Thiothrix winogradskyi]UJS26250.1 hypothetical protein L2Y54_09485 [Thiothrix winogradskyi]